MLNDTFFNIIFDISFSFAVIFLYLFFPYSLFIYSFSLLSSLYLARDCFCNFLNIISVQPSMLMVTIFSLFLQSVLISMIVSIVIIHLLYIDTKTFNFLYFFKDSLFFKLEFFIIFMASYLFIYQIRIL